MRLGSARRVTGNAMSLLASDMVNRATTFGLYILVGRYLGPYEFGQMSLALTLFYLFQVLAAAGLKMFITREVARDRMKTGEYVVHGSAAVLLTSGLSMSVLWLFTRIMNYSPDTATVVLLMGFALFPYALSSVSEGVFQAWEEMRYITYANSVAHVGKLLAAFLLLSFGYGLYAVVFVLLAANVMVAILEWWLMFRRIERPPLRVDGSSLLATLKSTSTFLGIDGTIAIMTSTNVVLLSALASESEVGFYSAAAQLLIPVGILFRAVGLAAFPGMVRKFQSSVPELKLVSGRLIELMLVIALPAVVGLYFLSGPALLLIYGDQEFLAATAVLQIMSWGLISTALTKVLGQVLLAGLKEKITLQIVLVDASVGLLLGFVLISRFGVMGAAATTLIVRMLDLALHYLPAARILGGIAIAKWFWKPAVASLVMAAYLSAVEDRGFLVAGISAGLLYLVVLGVLFVWSLGGTTRVKADLRNLWP